MFTVLRTQPIEYVSLYDEAVDDSAMTLEAIKEYARTRDISKLPLRPGRTPITWVLFPLDSYTLRYALSASPHASDGSLFTDMLAYHLVQVGLKEAKNLPDGAPLFNLRKMGMLELVADDFVKAIPPEVVREVGSVIYDISTVSDDAKKKSPSHSDEPKLKSGSIATPAPKG